MWVLAPTVTSLKLLAALHPPYTHRNSLRPHQIHSHYKRIFLFHLLHNTLHPTIKFTSNYSCMQIFLLIIETVL